MWIFFSSYSSHVLKCLKCHMEQCKVRNKGNGYGGNNVWGACFVISGIHMILNSGWQSVWCFPIFHYQAAGLAVRPYLLMSEWTTDLMDRWMALLMNAWQVLCQSGRQSKSQAEGRNHLDCRDTSSLVSPTTQNPTCPHFSWNPHPHYLIYYYLLSNCTCNFAVNQAAFIKLLWSFGNVGPISAGSNLEKCP